MGTADSAKAVQLESQLKRLRAERDSSIAAIKARNLENARPLGSRFNLRFGEKRMRSITSESIMSALANYVYFSREIFNRTPEFLAEYTDDPRRAIVIYSDVGGQQSFGTGFVFMIQSSKAFVLTAGHVVSDEDGFAAGKIEIEFAGEVRKHQGEIFTLYKEVDVAVIVVDEPPSTAGMLKLGKSSEATSGDRVYVYGHPGGGDLSRDEGGIDHRDSNRIFLDDISPVEGNSGSPLISVSSGESIGLIIQRSLGDEQYALEMNQVELLLRKRAEFAPLFEDKSIPKCLK